MFVSETNLFSGDTIKLRMISAGGTVWDTDISPTINIEKLTTMAVCHFYDPTDTTKIPSKYKLIHVPSKKSLDSEKTLTEEEVRNFDEILLVERRTQPPRELYSDAQNLKGPTEAEVAEQTRNVTPKNNPILPAVLDTSLDTDMRRILFSLVEAAARLLAPSPNGMEIFNTVRNHLRSKSQPTPDTRSVRQLVDMGFPEQQVIKALTLKRLNASDALEWLLQHQEDTEEADAQGLNQEQDDFSKINTPEDKVDSVIEAFAALLETFREARRREFKPNVKAVDNLKEMGFDEEESKEALRITGNNQASACAWLLGERGSSLQDLDQGLDVEGSVYKAIMANPTIQLSLTNPKVLLAFLSMLENPSTAKVWFNDRDTSPILNQVFKIYHTEKHAMRAVPVEPVPLQSGTTDQALDTSNSSSGTAL